MNLKDFNADGHWYTSYPSLNHWTEKIPYAQRLREFTATGAPAHLYIHIPFCAKLCYYCICNIIITNQRDKIQFFLDKLIAEIKLLAAYDPNIREIQLGGGTPSHLDNDQFSQLCDAIKWIVDPKKLAEFAMEIDPRTVSQDQLRHYASRGVTRISFGVQDFDLKVQEAINRVQPPEMIEALLEVRDLFAGVNFDLLYGLPLQTMDTIASTVARTIKIAPDRITLLKYCHAPEVRAHMKLIDESQLPPKETLQGMFDFIVKELLAAGYVWIGLDHFALPTDSLAVAARDGTVGRTFNGFTPGRVRDMIGLGPTSTGAFGNTYAQAEYDLKKYYAAIDQGEFPILRGYTLSHDDEIRRDVVFSLMCNQRIDFNEIGNKYDIVPERYFERELMALDPDLGWLEDGLLQINEQGRIYLRNICKLFDAKDVKPEHHKIAQLSMTRRENPAHQSP